MLVYTESMNKFTMPGGYADKPTSGAQTKGKDGVRKRSKEGVTMGSSSEFPLQSLLPPPRLPGFKTALVIQ